MPTTRRSRSGTPGRDAQQKQQKIGQRPSAQNSKTEVTGSKTADVLKAEQSIENVRSTRRSQTVPETSAFVSRRTRGTKVEPIEQEEPASGKKTRKDVVKSNDAKQAEAGLTRSCKRTAGSPKDVGGKKQRISPAMSPKLVETTDVVKKPVATDVKKDEEKKKESNLKWEKSDAKKDEKCSDDTAKFWQKNLKNEDESVKVKAVRIQKSTTSVSDTVGSVSGIDVISPRRSSRAVVPNSRYRDMVEPGKKKSVIKTEIKKETNAPPPKKKKFDYTAISVQRQGESEEITEEVITEETKIDTFAQMNLMDDMLILPPSSANVLEAQQADSEPESTNTSLTGIKVIKYQGAKMIEYESDALGISNLGSDVLVETKLQIPGDTSKEVSDDSSAAYDNDLTGTAKSPDNLLQSGAIPEPQVIVIPSDSGKHVSKIIIPKDPYRARLEQAFEKKGSSMVIGPSIGKAKPKKIIVTPTHQHASKKEAQRAKMASHAENIQLKETGFGKDLGKATVTSVIYPQMKMSGTRTAPILHTPEKYVKYTVLPRKEGKTSAEVNLHCDEEASEMASTSSGVNDRSSAEVNVKVVYVKAKQKHVSNAESDASENLLPDQDEASSDNTVLNAESLQNKVVETGVASAEHIKANESEIENTAISNSEHAFLDLRGKEKTSSTEGSKSLELVEEVTSVPVEQKIANALCQVIEYKQPQPQTAIEYVLLDNKMVPIHKPYQTGSHRHTVRQAQPVNRVTPGRVEPGAQKEQSSDKKRLLSAAQTGISTVITQIGDGHSQSLTPVNNHSKYTISSCQLEVADAASSEEIQPDVQTARVIHGYIDHPVRGGSPTEIVEISTEAFNKEIYGEEITLDTVTGQIVEGTVDETSQDVSETESQSVEDAAGFQPMEQTEVNQSEESSENQSVIEVTQSRIVKADNEATVIYTEGEEGSHVEDITSWSVGTPVVTSDTGMLMTVPASETNVSARDALVHLEGLDDTQIPENATITVEKLASGGEIVIMQIKETAVSETLEKIKTSESDVGGSTSGFAITKTPAVVKAKVIKKTSSGLKILPVQKLSEVKITPVRAYDKSGAQSSDKGESSAGVVSKTTGTNTESSDAEDTELEEEEEEEEGIKFEETSPSKGNPYQEYIVVRLPEGAEVKQLQARPRMETKPLGEEVTMDEEGMYICVDCGHKTENRGNWFKHRRKHLGIRPHACPKCSYRAATSSNLKRHMQIHDDVRNFQCAYCNTLFRQKIHLERHLKYKHEEKNVQCPLCDYVCSSENPDLKIHIKRRHMPHEGALNAFTCDVCGLMTVSKKDLKQHKKFHKNGPELKLFCEHCSFVTDCVSRLRRHMLIHTKERPFQCGLCTYRATQKEHVLRHMRSQHGVEVERNQRRSLLEKNYHNPQEILVAGMDQSSSSSNKEVPSESDLGPFEKSDYSSTDKIFACNYCSMKFSKLINLYKHLYAQHKQVMPDEGPNDFQCVVCDFRTNNKKNLLVHMRKHNMQDHSPPTHVYSCVLCRYINPRRRNLFQHMKKKHGIEIIMKDDGLNCYVTLENAAAQVQGQNVKSSVMALSDIVTTQTMDDAAQNLFIGESGEDTSTFQSEKITIDNIISDDMESYVVTDSSQEQGIISPQVSVSTIPHASVQEHEAAEAIEGLQALAEQAGILETQNIDNDMTTEIVSSAIEIASTEIMNDGEVLNADETMMTTEAAAEEQPGQATEEGFELSTEQLNQLATGDYVEINGEVYKVEIAPEAS